MKHAKGTKWRNRQNNFCELVCNLVKEIQILEEMGVKYRENRPTRSRKYEPLSKICNTGILCLTNTISATYL